MGNFEVTILNRCHCILILLVCTYRQLFERSLHIIVVAVDYIHDFAFITSIPYSRTELLL